MTAAIAKTRIVQAIDPSDFRAASQAIQADLDAITSTSPPSPRFPWAIALAAAIIGFGLGVAMTAIAGGLT